MIYFAVAQKTRCSVLYVIPLCRWFQRRRRWVVENEDIISHGVLAVLATRGGALVLASLRRPSARCLCHQLCEIRACQCQRAQIWRCHSASARRSVLAARRRPACFAREPLTVSFGAGASNFVLHIASRMTSLSLCCFRHRRLLEHKTKLLTQTHAVRKGCRGSAMAR